jgi:uncharacterized protein with von Willebrand factor type A (vWA) domain
MADAVLFRSVDTGIFASALVKRLRGAGIDVGLSSTARFRDALDCCPPTDTATLYWVARTCLVRDKGDFEAFNDVFDVLFNDASLAIAETRANATGAVLKAEGNLLTRSAPTDGLEVMAGRARTGQVPEITDDDEQPPEAEDDTALPELLPSDLANVADTPFDQLSPAQLDEIGAWLHQSMANFPTRRSRRHEASSRGSSIDLRRTLVAARSTGGMPINLATDRVRKKRRGIVMVGDVSGSMESFTRIYLHLMRSLVVFSGAEVFTFATTVRRVTVPLRDKNPQAAIDRMSTEVEDRFGGTRIAASIGELVSSPVWSNTLRGSVVLIASDGWDSDSPEELTHQMKRLGRMAHQVIWINPRSADPEFEPLVGGMAAALPLVDHFVSGHSLGSVRQLLETLAG